MQIILIGLMILSILLFVLSFFLRDPYKELKNEFDEFTMQQIQDTFQLKRKIKILEEELLMDGESFTSVKTKPSPPKKQIHAIIKNQVWSLAQQGISVENIAKQSSLSNEDVNRIIAEFAAGDHYE